MLPLLDKSTEDQWLLMLRCLGDAVCITALRLTKQSLSPMPRFTYLISSSEMGKAAFDMNSHTIEEESRRNPATLFL